MGQWVGHDQLNVFNKKPIISVHVVVFLNKKKNDLQWNYSCDGWSSPIERANAVELIANGSIRLRYDLIVSLNLIVIKL